MTARALETRLRRARKAGMYKRIDYPRKRAQKVSKFDECEFVAIDGEGFSEGPELEHVVGQSGAVYRGKRHYYAYLAASDGSSVYTASGRLSVEQALTFLCEIKINNPRAVVVAFGGSYDVNHMVMYGLDREQLQRLLGKGADKRKLFVEFGEYKYSLEYRPRKCFTIQRWRADEPCYARDGKGVWKTTPHLTVKVWDVWGFFQDSFTGVLSKWLPGDPDFEFIQRMKGERRAFHRSEINEIARYNAAELRCLVKVMEKVRSAIADLGLKITRWDGAGAIAAAMLAKHGVKNHKSPLPADVFEAARCAYSGGHIECCKIGYHKGKVHHYDVNSAYPNSFRRLPSLAGGQWEHIRDAPEQGYALVHLEWRFAFGAPFYPLFFRSNDGSITYPASGRGWYWLPEYHAARRFCERFGCVKFEVLECWALRTTDDATGSRPFEWVETYYADRRLYIDQAKREGRVSGPEKIIKLGLNSLYGKTAQQVGARMVDGELIEPPYFQLDWAGYVTSHTRAMLMEAALQKPQAIIGFATDGLFALEPLDLHCPEEKELGAWEYQVHDGITMVMPGVYWLHDGETVKHYSRGFNKAQMSDVEIVHEAWRRKQDRIPIEIERLIGMGTACASKEFWKMRGRFVKSERSLCLDGDNSKRYPIMLYNCAPERGLVDTMPRSHFAGDMFDDIPDSAPYPISWIDGELSRDELEGELADEWEAMDAELA